MTSSTAGTRLRGGPASPVCGRRPGGPCGEDGFTLTELIVALALLGIIALTLIPFRLAVEMVADADARLVDAGGMELFATLFAEDVRTAVDVRLHVPAPACDERRALAVVDRGPGNLALAYVVQELDEGPRLVRLECLGGGVSTRTPLGPVLVAASGEQRWSVAMWTDRCGDRGCVLAEFLPPRPLLELRPGAARGEGFADAGHALVLDEDPEPLDATALLSDGEGVREARLELTGFTPVTALQPGTRLDAALLHVTHHERGDLASLTISVQTGEDPPLVLQAEQGDCNGAIFFCLGEQRHRDTIDLVALGLDRAAHFEDLRITYTATLADRDDRKDQAEVALDGLGLELRHSPQLLPADATGEPFTTPERALVIGERPQPLLAEAVLSRQDGRTEATLQLTGFALTEQVPDDARLHTVLLHLAHRETGDLQALTVTLFPARGEPVVLDAAPGDCAQGALCIGPDLHLDEIDLLALGLDRLDELQGLRVAYSARLPDPGPGEDDQAEALVALDGAAVEIGYSVRRPFRLAVAAPWRTIPGGAR